MGFSFNVKLCLPALIPGESNFLDRYYFINFSKIGLLFFRVASYNNEACSISGRYLKSVFVRSFIII